MDKLVLQQELLQLLDKIEVEINNFKKKDISELNWKPTQEKWSVLECVEHLNRYGKFYLPEIQKVLKKEKVSSDKEFKPGFLGDYFAKSMKIGTTMKPMKTFKNMNPINSQLNKSVLETALVQCLQLKELLVESEKVNWTKTKTSITLTRFIRLRLGDTFRFLVYHLERHIVQAKKVAELHSNK